MKKQTVSDATRCLQVGASLTDQYRGVTTPIFTSTAYSYLDVDEYVYPRYFNTPNLKVVERLIASLEQAEEGMVFSSGMAATMSVLLSFLKQGDHILLQNDLYGGTIDSVQTEMAKFGISVTRCKPDVKSLNNALTPQTKVFFFESPTNPLLQLSDIGAISDWAKSKGIMTVFDNTFGTPICQKPHQWGVDIIIHSGTKYLGGHSDLCCGAATGRKELIDIVRETSIHLGGNLDPQSAYLLERSIKTLHLRVNQQSSNALDLAEWLSKQNFVDNVYYPGLPTHPNHEIALKQMGKFGGMLSFELLVDPHKFTRNLQLIHPVMSLGAVESTITSPILTSHARVSEEDRKEMGITPGLLRMSVGIEDVNDLKADILEAIKKAG